MDYKSFKKVFDNWMRITNNDLKGYDIMVFAHFYKHTKNID